MFRLLLCQGASLWWTLNLTEKRPLVTRGCSGLFNAHQAVLVKDKVPSKTRTWHLQYVDSSVTLSVDLISLSKAECRPGNDPRSCYTPCPRDGIPQHAYNYFWIDLFAVHGCTIGFSIIPTGSLRYYQSFCPSYIGCIQISSTFGHSCQCWIGPSQDFKIKGDFFCFKFSTQIQLIALYFRVTYILGGRYFDFILKPRYLRVSEKGRGVREVWRKVKSVCSSLLNNFRPSVTGSLKWRIAQKPWPLF